jgi:DNA-binding transcriptional LysR family regulator
MRIMSDNMEAMESFIRTRLKQNQLRLVVALDDVRHVGRLAASSNLTQPAISKSLGELERGVGLKLFERTTRGVTPTLYGECLIRYARAILMELGHARDELRHLMSGTAGRVSVGALSATVHTLVPRSIVLLKRRSPGTNVVLRESTLDQLLEDLWAGKVDLIVGRFPNDRTSRHLERMRLADEPLTLAAGAQHPLAKRKRMQWSDLKGYPWVIPPIGSILREPVERVFAHHGIPMPMNRLETGSIPAICSYLRMSDAIAPMAGDVSMHYQKQGILARLPLHITEFVPSVGNTWTRERALSLSAKLFVQCLQETAAESS